MKDKTVGAPRRRVLLQRGAALLGGAIGLGGTARVASAAIPAADPARPDAPETLRFYGKRRTRARVGRAARQATAAPAAYGDLALEPGAAPVGSFRSNGLGQAGAFPDLPVTALEIQTFELADGTLFGIGAPAGRDGERHCAVLGGTGRYATSRGSYLERPAEAAGLVEFVFTLKS
jgi:hypothetical protein